MADPLGPRPGDRGRGGRGGGGRDLPDALTRPQDTKNRVHPDLTTSAEDREAEIERLLGLGATRVDVGQTGEESWDVLADPEGNEFCVVRPKQDLVR